MEYAIGQSTLESIFISFAMQGDKELVEEGDVQLQEPPPAYALGSKTSQENLIRGFHSVANFKTGSIRKNT